MKSFFVLGLAMCLIVCGLPFSSNALIEESFNYTGKEVIVVYEGERLSDKKIESIVAYFSGESTMDESNIDVCSILCIFGHNIRSSKAYVYDHNYYTTSPYCRKSIYEVEVCTRESCTYMTNTLSSQIRTAECHG